MVLLLEVTYQDASLGRESGSECQVIAAFELSVKGVVQMAGKSLRQHFNIYRR